MSDFFRWAYAVLAVITYVPYGLMWYCAPKVFKLQNLDPLEELGFMISAIAITIHRLLIITYFII